MAAVLVGARRRQVGARVAVVGAVRRRLVADLVGAPVVAQLEAVPQAVVRSTAAWEMPG